MSAKERNLLLLAFAWLVAITATAGSLYFSQVRGFIPCELCWYQRILMYPLVIILGIAVYKGDVRIRPYVVALAGVGGLISALHYLEQKLPGFHPTACKATPIPCNLQYVNYFGFVTIPLMALTAFLLILLAMALIRPAASDRA